jgi:RsiW-degrading membrane proteinase PrsW (M82 family)
MSLVSLKNTAYNPIDRVILLSVILVTFLIGGSVFADTLPAPVKIGLPFEGTPVATSIGRIIRQMIMFTGVFAIMALTYGGILMMLSYGDESKVKQAKSIVSYALVGVVLAGAAYAIIEAVNALKLV